VKISHKRETLSRRLPDRVLRAKRFFQQFQCGARLTLRLKDGIGNLAFVIHGKPQNPIRADPADRPVDARIVSWLPSLTGCASTPSRSRIRSVKQKYSHSAC